jgi:HTH-type transcriptional regulator/antitoxin HigA
VRLDLGQSPDPVEPPVPIEAIQFRMEQQGLIPKDLAAMIGRSNRVVEVLLRRRPLTLASDGIKIT